MICILFYMSTGLKLQLTSVYVLPGGGQHILTYVYKGMFWTGRYCMVVGFITTYAISTYHH